MENLVCLKYLNDYDVEQLEQAVRSIFLEFNMETKLKPKSKVLLKVCMPAAVSPDLAETTHPAVIQAVANVLTEMGVKCIVADCVDKRYSKYSLDTIYYNTGLLEVANLSKCVLNRDLSTSKVELPEGVKTKSLLALDIAKDVDAIINIGKLKFDDKLGYLGVASNMFGVVPGDARAIILNRLTTLADYNNYIIDINEHYADKVVLNMLDGIVAMEANKTQHMLSLLGASENPYSLDAAILGALGVDLNKTIIKQACERKIVNQDNLCNYVGDKINKFDLADFVVSEFDCDKVITPNKLKKTLYFKCNQQHVSIKPNKCKGCMVCSRICPTDAITMKYDKNGELFAKIDYSKCIYCNKCFTACPYAVMEMKEPVGYKLMEKRLEKENEK